MKLIDYQKASRLMDEAGIDVILASTRPSVTYLADYWHLPSDDYYVLWDTSVTHKTLIGIPKEEEKGPFLVAGASEMTSVSMVDPWIKERHFWGPGYYIQRWKEPNPDPGNPMDVAAQVLAEKGLEDGCIAVEKRYLGVSYFERLASLLSRATFADAEDILWKLRMVKSPEEVRRIRRACDATCKVWRRCMSLARSGMTEKEMEREFVKAFAEEGLDNERSYVVFGPAGLNLLNGSPMASDNPLKQGQFIRVDVQGRYEGYICNLSRVIAFGEITPEMKRAHGLVKDMVEKLIPILKPGVPVSDIRAFELNLYEGTGYEAVVPYTGHGVGLKVHEPPYLSQVDDTVLEPNMVVTVEPTVQYSADGDIFISIEDQLLITENGAEWLTADAPLDLYL